ncbi:MAG: MFS transporter, partial [Nanoarchaeota archaeon]
MAISLKRFRFKTISILLFIGLIISISNGLFNTIWALFLDSFLHNESYVGLFSTLISIVALISFVIFIPIIEKYQENKVYIYSLAFSIFILFLYSITKSIYLVFVLALIYIMFGVLRAESFGIMYRNESKTKALGKNEGLVYTLSNLGWLLGPLLGAFLLRIYDIPQIFSVEGSVEVPLPLQ